MKVKGSNSESVPKIKGMRILAMRAGVEAEGIAVRLPGQRDKPLDHRLAMSLRARPCVCHQIVHIKSLPARQHILHAESRDRNDRSLMLKKSKLISLGLLRLHATDKLRSNQLRTKLAHYWKAAVNLSGRSSDLDSPHASVLCLPILFGTQMRDVGNMMARVPCIQQR